MYDLIQLMHGAASHAAKVGFFQLLRQGNASCRRLLAVLSGYHIRKCRTAPQHYFHQCESSLRLKKFSLCRRPSRLLSPIIVISSPGISSFKKCII